MKKSRIIEVTVSTSGETRIETRGFSGNSCREASRFLEDALGAPIHEQTTAEFHHSERAQQVHSEQA